LSRRRRRASGVAQSTAKIRNAAPALRPRRQSQASGHFETRRIAVCKSWRRTGDRELRDGEEGNYRPLRLFGLKDRHRSHRRAVEKFSNRSRAARKVARGIKAKAGRDRAVIRRVRLGTQRFSVRDRSLRTLSRSKIALARGWP